MQYSEKYAESWESDTSQEESAWWRNLHSLEREWLGKIENARHDLATRHQAWCSETSILQSTIANKTASMNIQKRSAEREIQQRQRIIQSLEREIAQAERALDYAEEAEATAKKYYEIAVSSSEDASRYKVRAEEEYDRHTRWVNAPTWQTIDKEDPCAVDRLHEHERDTERLSSTLSDARASEQRSSESRDEAFADWLRKKECYTELKRTTPYLLSTLQTRIEETRRDSNEFESTADWEARQLSSQIQEAQQKLATRGQQESYWQHHKKAEIVSLGNQWEHLKSSTKKKHLDELLERAGRSTDTGNFRRGILDVNRALQIEANSALAYCIRGDAYFGCNDYDTAKKDYQTAIQHEMNWSRPRVGIARIFEVRKDYVNAREYYRQAIKLNPNYKYAIERLTAVERIIADWVEVYLERARLKVIAKDDAAAIQDYNRVLHYESQHINALYLRGKCHVRLRNLTQAIADFDAVIKINHNHLLAYYALAQIYQKLENVPKAIWSYGNVLRIDNDHADAAYQRGILYHQTQQYESAVADFTNVIRCEPQYKHAYLKRAQSNFQNKNYSAAIPDFLIVTKRYNHVVSGHYGLGLSYYHLAKHQEAIPALTKTVQLAPEHGDAWYHLGYSMHMQNDWEGAVASYSKAIEHDASAIAEAYFYRGMIRQSAADPTPAIDDFMQAIRLGSVNRAEAHFLKGQLHYKKKEYAVAVEEQLNAIKLKPQHVDAHHACGLGYEMQNQPHLAYQYYNKALKIDPNHRKARDDLARLHMEILELGLRNAATNVEAELDILKKIHETWLSTKTHERHQSDCHEQLLKFTEWAGVAKNAVAVHPDGKAYYSKTASTYFVEIDKAQQFLYDHLLKKQKFHDLTVQALIDLNAAINAKSDAGGTAQKAWLQRELPELTLAARLLHKTGMWVKSLNQAATQATPYIKNVASPLKMSK